MRDMQVYMRMSRESDPKLIDNESDSSSFTHSISSVTENFNAAIVNHITETTVNPANQTVAVSWTWDDDNESTNQSLRTSLTNQLAEPNNNLPIDPGEENKMKGRQNKRYNVIFDQPG